MIEIQGGRSSQDFANGDDFQQQEHLLSIRKLRHGSRGMGISKEGFY